LHVAALHGFLEVVQYVLPYFENPNEKDMLGLTALDYAERGGHAAVIEALKK